MPLYHYFKSQKIKLNDAQNKVAQELNAQLTHTKKFRFLNKEKNSFYLWGKVGRGKTMLMDAYFNKITKPALRVHYHQFFKDLYKALKGAHKQKNELIKIAKQISQKYQVICFDEFHLHDVTNTVLMEIFLTELVKNKVQIILTSNYEPSELLPEPTIHKHALALIGIIETNFKILNLIGKTDYRYQIANTQIKRKTYLYPHQQSTISSLLKLVTSEDIELDFENSQSIGEIQFSMGSKVITQMQTLDTVFFKMQHICAGNYSHLDYLEIAEQFSKVVILNIKQDDLNHPSTLRRLIWLIDILYDKKIQLFTTSETELFQMLSQISDYPDLSRTSSRLTQMQALEYFESKD